MKEPEETPTQPITVRMGPKFTKAETELAQLAMHMGFMLIDTAQMKGELASAITARMQAMSGDFVYQIAQFTLTNMTRWFLDSILPEAVVTIETPNMKKWSMLTVDSVNLFLPHFLETYAEGFTVTGCSRRLIHELVCGLLSS